MAEKKPRASFTYGYLPSEDDFGVHWDAYVGANEKFEIVANEARGPIRDLTGKHTEMQIYDILHELVEDYNEEGSETSAALASDILETLGFEWI